MGITAWFQSLVLMEQIFAVCAVPATVVLVLQTAMLLFGLGGSGGSDSDLDSDVSGVGDGADMDAGGTDIYDGHDFDVGHDFDAGHGHDHNGSTADTGLRLFTVRGIITFFTLFGWTGLACMQSFGEPTVSIMVAFLVGIAGMAVTAFIMKSVLRLQSDGTVDLTNALGKSASVYIRIPKERSGRGKVNVIVQEQLRELSAVTDEGFDLPTDSEVVVVGMTSGDTLLVASKK